MVIMKQEIWTDRIYKITEKQSIYKVNICKKTFIIFTNEPNTELASTEQNRTNEEPQVQP